MDIPQNITRFRHMVKQYGGQLITHAKITADQVHCRFSDLGQTLPRVLPRPLPRNELRQIDSHRRTVSPLQDTVVLQCV